MRKSPDKTKPRVIYKLTSPSGKIYIGQSMNYKKRREGHKNMYNEGFYITNAIAHYGFENFKEEIVQYCKDAESAGYWEDYFICLYDTMAPKGYNLKRGGVVAGCSEITREKMSYSSQGQITSRLGTSKFIGVFVPKNAPANKQFMTCIVFLKKRYRKSFSNEIEAAEAYDKCALFLFGLGAKINFTEKTDSYVKAGLEQFFLNFSSKIRFRTSKYNGVSRLGGVWRVSIRSNGSSFISLKPGSFETEELAAKAVDKIILFYGLTLELNFPEESSLLTYECLQDYIQSITFPSDRTIGVILLKDGKWRACLPINGKDYNVGLFKTKDEAVKARDAAIQDPLPTILKREANERKIYERKRKSFTPPIS